MNAATRLYDWATLEIATLTDEQIHALPMPRFGDTVNGKQVVKYPRDSASTPRIGTEQK